MNVLCLDFWCSLYHQKVTWSQSYSQRTCDDRSCVYLVLLKPASAPIVHSWESFLLWRGHTLSFTAPILSCSQPTPNILHHIVSQQLHSKISRQMSAHTFYSLAAADNCPKIRRPNEFEAWGEITLFLDENVRDFVRLGHFRQVVERLVSKHGEALNTWFWFWWSCRWTYWYWFGHPLSRYPLTLVTESRYCSAHVWCLHCHFRINAFRCCYDNDGVWRENTWGIYSHDYGIT